ncbi:hypothetical protein ACLB1E_34025 [Escherichia coli]
MPTHPHCPSRDIHDRRLCAAALVECQRHRDEDRQSRSYVDPRTVAGIAESLVIWVTRFVAAPVRAWLELFVGQPAAQPAGSLQRIDLPEDLLAGVPAHATLTARRVNGIMPTASRSTKDAGFQILVCISEWQAMLADAVVKPTTGSSAVYSTCFGAYLPCERSQTKRGWCVTP